MGFWGGGCLACGAACFRYRGHLRNHATKQLGWCADAPSVESPCLVNTAVRSVVVYILTILLNLYFRGVLGLLYHDGSVCVWVGYSDAADPNPNAKSLKKGGVCGPFTTSISHFRFDCHPFSLVQSSSQLFDPPLFACGKKECNLKRWR